MIGKTVGSYSISARLGAGGMGEVFRATDTRLGREVAIKFSAEQFTDRFEREARAVAALNHPNIFTLHDVGPNYLVMASFRGLLSAKSNATWGRCRVRNAGTKNNPVAVPAGRSLEIDSCIATKILGHSNVLCRCVYWSGNTREIFYVATGGILMSAPVTLPAAGGKAEVGAPTALFTLPSGAAFNVARDGDHFLLNTTVGDVETLPITILLNWRR